ncbi:MAG: response regulator transcription factor [Deltaproteobacteria bacterium]|nr:response regulator transcription factor [Deltaproteobacteria bacterium]
MPRFLIVEDNTLMRKMLGETLRTRFSDAALLEAVNGKEALSITEEARPDLILMDIELPDSNGLDLTRRIKARKLPAKIVVISLYDGPEYREAAARNGADGFLSKRTASAEEIAGVVHALFEDQT